MASYSFTQVVGDLPGGDLLQCQAAEGMVIALRLRTVSGAAHDGRTGYLRFIWNRPGHACPGPLQFEGVASGEYSLDIAPKYSATQFTRLLDGVYAWSIWWVPATGASVRLRQGQWIVGADASPSPDTPLNALEAVASTPTPTLQQSLEITATLDLDGTAGAIPTEDPVYVPRGVPTGVTLTCPQLASTASPDPTATASLILQTTSNVRISSVALTQSETTPGVFRGVISGSDQALVGTAAPTFAAKYALTVTTGGRASMARMPSQIAWVETGIPPNIEPSVTLAPIAALVASGSLTISGTFADQDAGTEHPITSESFKFFVDGLSLYPQPEATIAGNGWSTSIPLTTAGQHTIAVTVTDYYGAIATASRTVTVQTLSIATPAVGATFDELPVAVTVTANPAVSSATALQLLVDGSPSGSPGTAGAGATTAQLSAGVHSLSARMTVSGATVTSVARSITIADQDPTVAITSHAQNQRISTGALSVYGTVAHPSALPGQLTVQFSLDDETFSAPVTGVYDSQNQRWGCSLTISGESTHVLRMRAWDLTSGGSVIAAAPVYLNAMPAYVGFTTSGSSFNPTIELHEGRTPIVTWTCVETSQTATGVNPTLTFGSSGVRHVRMTVAGDAFDAVRVVNLGFDHTDDAGDESPGADYDKTEQAVIGVEYTGNLTGLVYWLSANMANLVGTVDLRGALGLTFIEAYHSGVEEFLFNSTALRRICIEGCSCTALDLRSCRESIRDVRLGVQGLNIGQVGTRAVTFAQIGANEQYPNIWHMCTNETLIIGLPTGAQMPGLIQAWWWNGAQGEQYGSPSTYAFTSPVLTDVQIYGTNAVRGNRYTAIDLGPATAITTVRAEYNALTPAAVDSLILQVEACGTSNGTLNLGNCSAPTTATNVTNAIAALRGRGWTVTVRTDAGTGVDSDDFEAGTTLAERGWKSIGNETATASVIVYGGGHALNFTYTEYSMRRFGNPGSGVGPTHSANYSCEVQIAPEAFTSGSPLWNHGLLIKHAPWGGGIKLNFISPGGYLLGAPTSLEDNSFPRTVLHSLPPSWLIGNAVRRLKLSIFGDQCDAYAGAVGDATLTHFLTANLASVSGSVNRNAIDTYYCFCGGGSSDNVGTHVYPEITTALVTSAPPTDD